MEARAGAVSARAKRRETGNHATTNRCLPMIPVMGSPGRTTEPGLTRTLMTTPRSSIEGCHRHRARPTSGCSRLVFEADDMVAICRLTARPSPPNDVSRTNGRWRMIGSTGCDRFIASGRFRRRLEPRHRRENRVLGQSRLVAPPSPKIALNVPSTKVLRYTKIP